ncbi:hypothetical protein M413DRAFT_30747 [Hebeloma cylindrosporum]|uniref:DUF6534 domain-containing protein n=1 Tax=Hebeloma cylindrosporum TaxID=76867 RepID=A0A0C2XI66_HEBCY|nr:hypothetical protein M413DRAFT_30747 [Hebeloma cylindrosporum h7]
MPAPTIENTFGALEIGSSIAVFLFGIVTLQAFLYFTRFGKDHIQIKALVGTVWCLELGHTISLAYEVYRTTISLYGRPEAATKVPSFGALTILGGLITMLVQSFFSYRIWKLFPHPWRYLGMLCTTLAAIRGIMSVYAGIMGILSPSLVEYQVRFQTFIGAILLIGAGIDLTIAVSMVYVLLEMPQMGVTRSRVTRIVDRGLAYTIRTGIVTSIGAISVVALYHAMSGTLVYLAIYACIAKLYSNSLLSTLNSRGNLDNMYSKATSVELPRQNRPNVLYPKPPPMLGGAAANEMKKESGYKVDESKSSYQVPLPTSSV